MIAMHFVFTSAISLASSIIEIPQLPKLAYKWHLDFSNFSH